MGDYYYATPECKKCGHIQKEYVMVDDDPEFEPSHFHCEKCFARHTISCRMEFDIELVNDNAERIL